MITGHLDYRDVLGMNEPQEICKVVGVIVNLDRVRRGADLNRGAPALDVRQ